MRLCSTGTLKGSDSYQLAKLVRGMYRAKLSNYKVRRKIGDNSHISPRGGGGEIIAGTENISKFHIR